MKTGTNYAVVAGEYSDYRVLAVCGDEATAKAWAKAIRESEGYCASDASVEAMTFIPVGMAPAKQHWVRVTEEWWNDGTATHFAVQEEDEYPIASYHGEAPIRPKAWFVRAPIHNGRGGRIEVTGRSRQACMKVYSEQKAMWKSAPEAFKVPA